MKLMFLALIASVGLFTAEKASAVADPGSMSSCHFEYMYINNNMEPTSVPWYYCICPGSAVEPTSSSWDMGGGEYTQPHHYCFHASVPRP